MSGDYRSGLGRGITNAQASYLAALCRELGRPYFGSGLSRQQASKAIEQLLGELGDRRRGEPGPRRARPTSTR